MKNSAADKFGLAMMRTKDSSGHRISTWASPFSHCLHAGHGG